MQNDAAVMAHDAKNGEKPNGRACIVIAGAHDRTKTEPGVLGQGKCPETSMALWIRAGAAFAVAAGALSGAWSAAADPCQAIPDKGPMPPYLKPGATFSGPVTYVGDGDSICVAVGAGRQAWVEVRVADFYAPELHEPGGLAAKAAMSHIAVGRRTVCVAGHRSYDRVVARCTIAGQSLGDRMRASGTPEGGRGRSPNEVDPSSR